MIKTAVIRAAANTTTGTQDFTSDDLGGLTPKAAIFLVTGAVTDGTVADGLRYSFGVATGVGQQWFIHTISRHGLASSSVGFVGGNDAVIHMQTASDVNVTEAEGVFDSFITDGVRIDWTDAPDNAYLVTVILLAGDDLSARASTGDIADTQDDFLDHTDPGFEPDLVIFGQRSGGMGSSGGSTAGVFNIGVAHNGVGITQRGATLTERGNRPNTELYGHVSDLYTMMNLLQTGAINYAVEVTAFISTGFTITTRVGDAGGADKFGYLALKFDNHSSWVGSVDTPTSTGNDAQTGPGFKPQFLMQFLTAFVAFNSGTNTDTAGAWGISVVDQEEAYSNTVAGDDGAPDSDTQSLSDDVPINMDDATGTDMFAATFVSFDTNGWTLNFSDTDATVRKWWGLAIEEDAAGGGETVTPDPAVVEVGAVDPTIVRGAVTVTPTVAEIHAEAVDPTVISGITVTPAAAEVHTIANEGFLYQTGHFDHESGDLSAYQTFTNPDDLSADSAAALAGSDFGLKVVVDDTTNRWAEYVLPALSNSGIIRFRFYFDPNGLTMVNGNTLNLLVLKDSANTAFAQLSLGYSDGHTILGRLIRDGGSTSNTGTQAITDAPHYIELQVTRATNSTSSDGTYSLWVDGVHVSTITGHDNYDRFNNFGEFNFGAIAIVGATISGVIYLDELVYNNSGDLIGATVYPTTANVVVGAVDPTVVRGAVTVTPTVAEAETNAVDPTAVRGPLTVTPGAAEAHTEAVDPTVPSSATVTPDPAIAEVAAVDPYVTTAFIVNSIVTSGDDDADETADGTFIVDGDAINMDASISDLSQRWSGMSIFRNTGIPSGATIQVAHMVVRVWESGEDDANLDFYAEDVDTPDDFTTTPDINDRVLTTANVSWIQDNISLDDNTETPSLVSIIQEVVDRPGFSGDIGIVGKGRDDVNKRIHFPAYEFSTTLCARLYVEYVTPVVLAPDPAPVEVGAVDPTAVRGPVTVTPGAAEAHAEATDPAAVRGAFTVTPDAAEAHTEAVDPTVPLSATVTPDLATVEVGAVDPTIELGAATVTPDVAEINTEAIDPTAVRGALSVTPDPAIVSVAAVDPSIELGAATVTPDVAAVEIDALDPTVELGAITLTPEEAIVVASAVDPSIELGASSVTPAPAIAETVAIDPTVQLSATVTPDAAIIVTAAVDPTTVRGALTVTPTVAIAVTAAVDPTAIRGAITVTPGASVVSVTAVDPSLTFGAATVTPTSSIVVVTVADPTSYISDIFNPTQDISVNGWTNELDATTDLFESIDEFPSISDADYVKSPEGPSGEIFRVKIDAPPFDPHTEELHEVVYRYRRLDTTTVSMKVRLMEGVTTIVEWEHISLPDDWTTVIQTLTTGQAGNIGDYSDLFLEFEAEV